MRNIVLILAGIITFFALSSTKCNKENPPKATVTVIDTAGHYVSGATVKVYSDPTYYNNGQGWPSVGYYNPDEKTLYDTQTSDASGQTHHSFKYESIYSVKVTVLKKIGTHSYDTLRYNGEGALVLKNNKTYEETVTIYPSN